MKVKAVLFDLDGTLLDTVESIAMAGNEALNALGYPALPTNNYKYYAGDGADTLCRRMLADSGDVEGVHFEKCFQIYSDFFAKSCTYHVAPFDDILSLLATLKKMGIKTAVVSNKPHARTLDVVGRTLGEHSFDVVLGQQDAIKKKPDASAPLLAAKKMGVSPAECLFIGDTNVDMQTGHNAQMIPIGVLWGFRDRTELEENHAAYIIESPMELLPIIETLK